MLSFCSFFLYTYILFVTSVTAFDPCCSSCKFFIPNKTGNIDLGLCKMFPNTSYLDKNLTIPNFATHCRNDENLCGKSGFIYESKNNMDTEIIREYDELNNRCCGEVNEKDEIDQLEKEFFEIFQKIKNHNKKRVYKTTKDLYKLFKMNKSNSNFK